MNVLNFAFSLLFICSVAVVEGDQRGTVGQHLRRAQSQSSSSLSCDNPPTDCPAGTIITATIGPVFPFQIFGNECGQKCVSIGSVPPFGGAEGKSCADVGYKFYSGRRMTNQAGHYVFIERNQWEVNPIDCPEGFVKVAQQGPSIAQSELRAYAENECLESCVPADNAPDGDIVNNLGVRGTCTNLGNSTNYNGISWPTGTSNGDGVKQYLYTKDASCRQKAKCTAIVGNPEAVTDDQCARCAKCPTGLPEDQTGFGLNWNAVCNVLWWPCDIPGLCEGEECNM